VVSEIEPIFAATDAVARVLSNDQPEGERNTLMSRRFPGGSLKVVAAKAPRNFRRISARILFIDEADGMEVTNEGPPALLAERRTMGFPDRTIVIGSTPVDEETSPVLRAFAQSDQRVYEVPCPHCGDFAEMMWDQIEWDPGKPETARWVCPSNGCVVEESHKPAMVKAGRWRITRPEVKGHAGFRMNALVSPHENASWAKLAAEFVAVKDDPTTLKTFVNTILGQGWRGEGDDIDEDALANRVEAIGLDPVPSDVLAITVGCDVQHDRLENTIVGWSESGVAYVLGHHVIWGQWDEVETWQEQDEFLSQRFPHELGGKIGIDAACIDAGDGTTMQRVVDFCVPRRRRKVMAIKGVDGNRPLLEASQSKKGGGRLWIAGVDTGKQTIFARIMRGDLVRFSKDLPRVWFEQVTAERQVVRYRRGQPVRSFVRITGKRAEALDCLVYAFAAKQVVSLNWEARRWDLAQAEVVQTPKKKPAPDAWITPPTTWL
jgi:phage terminase large subunit GpA-like protein